METGMNLQAVLDTSLKELKLPTMLKKYHDVASSSLDSNYSYEQFLLSLSRLEIEDRFDKRIRYLLKSAKFQKEKTIDQYDFSQVEIKKEVISELCQGHFLNDAVNVILFGTPGTGKTLLARAVAHHTDCQFIRVSGSELV